MPDHDDVDAPRGPAQGAARLSPAARRALAEAEARRAALVPAAAPEEQGGRGGLDPVRYEDWEIAGRAVDF